jgi:hypothetical protein
VRVKSAKFLVLSGILLASGCSRTGLWQLIPEREDDSGRGGTAGSGGSGSKSQPECVVSEDCPVVDRCAPPVCVAAGTGARCEARPIDCDDGDACTFDRCDPDVGQCENLAPEDLDGDGYVGKAPPGAAAACGGADCDDEDASIHPGARESCNGKDDDCNGAVDDGSLYEPAGSPVELAPGMERSSHGSIVWNEQAYAVTYLYSSATFHKQSYFGLLDAAGRRLVEPSVVSDINADSFAGAVAWSGDSFLTVWADARQGGQYEIYATRFDSQVRKLSPDQRLTDVSGYSLRPVVRFTGSEYLVVWDDRRFLDFGGPLSLYGRRISTGGVPLADEVRLTTEYENAEYVTLAVGEERAGLAYVVSDTPAFARVQFRSLDLGFGAPTLPSELTADGQEPSIVRVESGFVVAWHTGSSGRGYGSRIEAALVDANGAVLARGPVTSGDVIAKHRTLVSLGDRVLLIWTGEGADGFFSLHYVLLSAADLTPLSERRELARSASGGDLIEPTAALGPAGDVGVLYTENRAGLIRAYFARLSCRPGLR